MTVTCAICGLSYDDVYRLTYCPHAPFDMRCVVHVGKHEKVCTRVEEVYEFIRAYEGVK